MIREYLVLGVLLSYQSLLVIQFQYCVEREYIVGYSESREHLRVMYSGYNNYTPLGHIVTKCPRACITVKVCSAILNL